MPCNNSISLGYNKIHSHSQVVNACSEKCVCTQMRHFTMRWDIDHSVRKTGSCSQVFAPCLLASAGAGPLAMSIWQHNASSECGTTSCTHTDRQTDRHTHTHTHAYTKRQRGKPHLTRLLYTDTCVGICRQCRRGKHRTTRRKQSRTRFYQCPETLPNATEFYPVSDGGWQLARVCGLQRVPCCCIGDRQRLCVNAAARRVRQKWGGNHKGTRAPMLMCVRVCNHTGTFHRAVVCILRGEHFAIRTRKSHFSSLPTSSSFDSRT